MPLACTTGYAFARFQTSGRTGRFAVLATQMLPPVALALPTFMFYRTVGLTNSLPGLMLVYAALNLPFLTWILMGFFQSVPADLEGAAMTDGATAWGAFWRIVLPVAAPGIAAAAVLGFILSWNEFLFALILGGPRTATVPVALASLQTSNGVEIAKVSAGVSLCHPAPDDRVALHPALPRPGALFRQCPNDCRNRPPRPPRISLPERFAPYDRT